MTHHFTRREQGYRTGGHGKDRDPPFAQGVYDAEADMLIQGRTVGKPAAADHVYHGQAGSVLLRREHVHDQPDTMGLRIDQVAVLNIITARFRPHPERGRRTVQYFHGIRRR